MYGLLSNSRKDSCTCEGAGKVGYMVAYHGFICI